MQFNDTRYNYIYNDLYFKKHIKDLILKNVNDDVFYKSYILKKNMVSFNTSDTLIHYSDKFNSNNIISDINRIENLEKNEKYMKPYLIKNSSDDYDYYLDQMYEDLDKINLNQTGNSIKEIHNMGCDIKISQCQLLAGDQFNFEKIPKIFYNIYIIIVKL